MAAARGRGTDVEAVPVEASPPVPSLPDPWSARGLQVKHEIRDEAASAVTVDGASVCPPLPLAPVRCPPSEAATSAASSTGSASSGLASLERRFPRLAAAVHHYFRPPPEVDARSPAVLEREQWVCWHPRTGP